MRDQGRVVVMVFSRLDGRFSVDFRTLRMKTLLMKGPGSSTVDKIETGRRCWIIRWRRGRRTTLSCYDETTM